MIDKNTDKQVIVIGSYIVALVMDTPRIPICGETLVGRNYRSAYGGKGSNQAIQASRLGAQTNMVTKVGRDNSGEAFVRLCYDEGIGSQGVYIDPQLPTATGFIICADSGANIIAIDIEVLNQLTEAEVDAAMQNVKPGDVVLLQFEIDPKIAFYAATRGRKLGATVILNPAPAFDLRNYDLSVIDYLTPNETEARVCLGLPPDDLTDEDELAKQLMKLGCAHVVITLGDKGSLLCDQEGTTHFAPYPLKQAIDTTGAGDSFNGALATALTDGMTVREAIPFANATAAFACTKKDTVPSFGTRYEIEAFIIATQKQKTRSDVD